MSQLEKVFLYKVYSALVETAGMRSTITLEALVSKCGLPFEAEGMADVVYKYLDAIAKYEAVNGRPMITAVITKQDHTPTQAFLKKCVVHQRNVSEREAADILKTYKNRDKIELWNQELIKLYQQWLISL